MTIIQSGGSVVRLNPPPEMRLREVVTEMTRTIEDLGWNNLSGDWRSDPAETSQDRKRNLQRIRNYRRRNPLAKQAAGLLQHYTVGQGVSWKAENKKVVARVADEFWDNTRNQLVLTSHSGQKWFMDRCFTDGEFFLVLFPDEEQGTCELGYLDAMYVDDVIYDEENSLVPKWYKVTKPNASYDFRGGTYESSATPNTVYYRDWRNDDAAPPGAKMEKGLIYHVMPEKFGKRGESQLAAALDWLKVHQDFMGDRATMNRAAAEVAWKKKRTGGASDVANEVERLRSTLATTLASWEQNPPHTSGSTIVENQGSTLEWVNKDTGAQGASADERGLRMMAGAGLGGIPNHYFGDEANANLATATAMELPLLKTYEDWQTFLRTVLANVLDYVLVVANAAGRIPDRDDERKYAERTTTQQAVGTMPDQVTEAFGQYDGDPAAMAGGMKLVMVPKPGAATTSSVAPIGDTNPRVVSWYIDFDFPPIIQKDVNTYVQALKFFLDMLPGENVESQKLIVEMALTAFGVNDLDQIMSRLYPEDMVAVLVPNRPPVPQLPPGARPADQPPQPGPPPPPPPKPVAEGVASLAEHRVRRLLQIASNADRAAEG